MSPGHQKAMPVPLEDTGGSVLEDRSSESGSDTLFSREGVRLARQFAPLAESSCSLITA